MDFKKYQTIKQVQAAQIVLPEDVKELARTKKSPTYLGAKVRHTPAIGGEPEQFDLLYKQNNEEVLLLEGEEGDYFVKTDTGIIGVKKEAFESEYKPVKVKAEKE